MSEQNDFRKREPVGKHVAAEKPKKCDEHDQHDAYRFRRNVIREFIEKGDLENAKVLITSEDDDIRRALIDKLCRANRIEDADVFMTAEERAQIADKPPHCEETVK